MKMKKQFVLTTAKTNVEEKDNIAKEYKFLNALQQFSLNKVLEKLKSGEIQPSIRDISVLTALKRAVAKESLDNVNVHFQSCNACIFDKSCSIWAKDSDCKFNISKDISNSHDLADNMRKLIAVQGDRVMRGLLIEKMDGNTVDADVSFEMSNYFQFIEQMKAIMDTADSIIIKAKGKGAISALFNDILPQKERVVEVSEAQKEMVPVGREKQQDL